MQLETIFRKMQNALTQAEAHVPFSVETSEFSNFASVIDRQLAKTEDSLSTVDHLASPSVVGTSSGSRSYYEDYQGETWITADYQRAAVEKPDLKTFREVTGLSFVDATEMLYGVIGTNADLRDWHKIMNSEKPLDATRVATRQLYNSEHDYALFHDADRNTAAFANRKLVNSLSAYEVLKRDGNFATINNVEGGRKVAVASSSGVILRYAGSTQAQIERTAWLFGFENPSLEIWT